MQPSSPIAIRAIDTATDDEALHAVFEVQLAGYGAEPAPFPLDPEAEALASLRALDPAFVTVDVLLATVEGEPAGMAVIAYPQRDNRGSARVNHLVVHPLMRRRGVGRALLDAVSAEAVGAGLVGRSLEQELDLTTVTAADLTGLRDQVTAARPESVADYELVRWLDRAPDDLVDTLAELRARMSTDTPPEDRPDEPEIWDADRVRDSERRSAARGRRQVAAAARHRASGALVGYTFLTVAPSTPETAYQEDTLVAAGHRGHRLGLLLKIDTLLALRALSPRTERILTWNAATNTPMLAVNAALAYRVVAEECEVRLAL